MRDISEISLILESDVNETENLRKWTNKKVLLMSVPARTPYELEYLSR